MDRDDTDTQSIQVQLDGIPGALVPHWPAQEASSIQLWSGQATVVLPNGTEVGHAELAWVWLPNPAIRAYTNAPADFSGQGPAHEPLSLRLEGVELTDEKPI